VLVRLAGLGLYFEDAWYCSAPCLDATMRERVTATARGAGTPDTHAWRLRLGALLANQVGLSPAVITKALDLQTRTGLRIGTQLVRMGAATEHEVLRALAAQAGVGYLTSLDVSRLQVSAALPGDAVRALGVVPFAANEAGEVLHVACGAPLPRLALSIVRHLTGQRVEPFLVADDRLAALIETYCGRAARPTGDAGFSPVVWSGSPGPAGRLDATLTAGACGGSEGPAYPAGRNEWRAASTSR
jgi:hypothetical protein